MRFSFAHNPQTRGYVAYYSVVLSAVCGTIILVLIHALQQGVFQSAMVFFEGFLSLFMLSRNKKVGNAFLSHLSSVARIARL